MDCLKLYMEPGYESRYWLRNICDGFFTEASASKKAVKTLTSLEKNGGGEPIAIIGTETEWLEHAVHDLSAANYRPVLISAGSAPAKKMLCSNICFDLYEAVSDCIHYLVGAGRTRIAALGLRDLDFCDKIKQKAFEEITAEMGLRGCACVPLDDAHIEDFVSRIDSFVGKYDAVICSNDTLAVFLTKRMSECGYDVPRSLYVIGMGNSSIGRNISIPLTSLLLDYSKLGRQAVRLCKYLSANPGIFRTTSYVKTELVIRDSTDNIPFYPAGDKPDIGSGGDEVYKNPELAEIIEIESFLQDCDDTDREIIKMMIRGLTYDEIASKLFIHIRTLSYRKTKMLKRLGVKTREEFCAKIKRI
ncbi:MAG: substrate-binding domain-containing protein [Clostridia bacterium]|nr:substrate-binding domain-containing protein [Clostridia bacterium]